MRWSLLVGRFWGTEIRLHASLLLLIPYALLAFQPRDVPGALNLLLLIAAIFACVALHEVGHTIAARLSGVQVTSIVLWPLGGFANLSHRPEKVLPDVLISAAGPLTNLLCFAFLAVVTGALRILEISLAFPNVTRLLDRLDVFPFMVGLTAANLSLALFNLVPIYPLDGGHIARSVLKWLFGERRADMIIVFISLPFALALVVAGIALQDFLIMITGLLLMLGSMTLNARMLNGLVLGGLFFLDRGGYYLKRADFDPAIRAYTRAIQRSPKRAGLYVSRALVYMNLLEIDQAMSDIEQALSIDPHHPMAWMMRGELLAARKEYNQAMDCYNHAIELRPAFATGYVDRGGLYQEMGDLNRAREELDKAVEIGRGSPVAYLMRSMLLDQLGDLQAARADTDKALRYAPQWMLVFPEIFLVGLNQHLDWALRYYERAIALLPNAYQAYQGRADALRVNDRPGLAIEDYSRAIRLAPRQAELYINRGRAYQALGAFAQAAQDYRLAAELAKKAHLRRQAQAYLAQLDGNAVMPPAASAAGGPPVPGEPAALSEEGE